MDYSKKTIFVSIASYRDIYCSRTLESIYKSATYPNNIYTGICIQNKEDDDDCSLPANLIQYSPNISTIRLKDYEAKGPTWARYLCASLFNNQDYFFQVDSHTLFEKGWDVILMSMIDEIKRNTGSVDVVLSHYPPSYEEHGNQKRDKNVVDTICQSFFNDKGMVSFLGAKGVDMTKDKYVQTPHIAAGMFFCEGKCINDVPYDPNLPNLFVGEEILHSARVWTAGYDIYSPTQITVYHLYTREDQPHVWDDKKTFDDTDALNKVKYILNLEDPSTLHIADNVKENIDKYGLGNKRSLQQFLDFAGIDAKNKQIYKNFCPKPHKIPPQSGVPDEEKTEGFTNFEGFEISSKNITTTILNLLLVFILLFLLFIVSQKKEFLSKYIQIYKKWFFKLKNNIFKK